MGRVQVCFGDAEAISSIGTAAVQTNIGTVLFHILEACTPFLLSLADFDRMGLYFNNLENVIVQCDKKIPIVRKYGHAFMMLEDIGNTLITAYNIGSDITEYHLTETELQHLNRVYGYPSIQKFENSS